VVACLALLASYQVLIWCHAVSASPSIHQWEDNVIRAERYADTPAGDQPVVLIGSSLMARLYPGQVGARVQNIAFSGGSPLTGAELVLRHPAAAAIIVEMSNLTSRPMDAELVEPATGGISFLRRWLSVFRREYQPVSVLVSAWKDHVLSERARQNALEDARKHKKKPKKPKPSSSPKVRSPAVDGVLAAYNNPLTAEKLQSIRKGAEELRQKLQALRQNSKVRVFMNHLPLDPAVDATTGTAQTLDLLHLVFPSPEWEWIPPPPATDWQTLDGLHLTDVSAETYAHYLRDTLQARGVKLD